MPDPNASNSHTPFLKVILPALAGVALSLAVSVPAWACAACFLGVFATAVALRRHAYADLYTIAAVVLFFFTVANAARPGTEIPYGQRLEMAVQVSGKPHESGRWRRATARVGHYRAAGEAWTRTHESIILHIDTSYREVGVGSQLIIRGWFNPVDTAESSYRRLMAVRGTTGRVFLTPGNLLRQAPRPSRTPSYYAARLQEAAISKLERLDMPQDRLSVVTAMTAGDKRAVDSHLRGQYGRSGSAHLLAVSGLHVGIVFVLLNLLLYMLPAARYGHIAKNIVAVAAIWLYAAMSGLSPSAVRAALMFSFAQAALATTSYRNALNIMLGSMTVMLALNPNYALDVSFQLSWAAVLAIFAFFPAVFRPLRTRFKALNAITAIIVIGITATVGTAPLISHYFGHIPLGGILTGPVQSVTAYVIVMGGVLWTLTPFGFGQPAFEWTLSAAAGVQNATAAWCADISWLTPQVRMPLWAVAVSYLLLAAAAVYLYNRPRRSETKMF